MIFLALLMALAAWQLVPPGPWLEQWFNAQFKRLGQGPLAKTGVNWIALVVLPCLSLGVLDGLLRPSSGLLWLLLAAVVLYSSFGRIDLATLVEGYTNGSRAESWIESQAAFVALGGDESKIVSGDWPQLQMAMLEVASYRGFERLFAVIFWFVVLGPAGALLYRLSFLANAEHSAGRACRLLWILEWPAVRLLGLTFAFTGNFVGCLQRWRQYAGCVQSSTAFVITHSVRGALSVTEGQDLSPIIGRRELTSMVKLLGRSLWFWLGTLALLSISQ